MFLCFTWSSSVFFTNNGLFCCFGNIYISNMSLGRLVGQCVTGGLRYLLVQCSIICSRTVLVSLIYIIYWASGSINCCNIVKTLMVLTTQGTTKYSLDLPCIKLRLKTFLFNSWTIIFLHNSVLSYLVATKESSLLVVFWGAWFGGPKLR